MMQKDDYVIVLDFLRHGKAGDRKAEPIAQTIGEKFFNLLEVVIKEGVELKPKDRIYIGEDKREEVKYIKGRIGYQELTGFSKNVLEEMVGELIERNESAIIEFFNKAGPLTTRIHSLELLPGIGKKHLWEILKKRREKPFESFSDLQARVSMLPDPKKIVAKRIIAELEGKERRRLFVGGKL